MTLARIAEILLPLYGIVAAGWLYARRRAPDMEVVNRLNMDVFGPALVFHALTSARIEGSQAGTLVLCGAMVVFGGGLLALPVARALGVPARTLLPPVMFNNAGNLGIPLCLLTFGEQALAAAVLLFITEMSLHMTVGLRLLDGSVALRALARTPLLLAALAGLACTLLGVQLPLTVARAVGLLGDVSVPLMLFALGVRLVGVEPRLWRVGLIGGLLRPTAGLLAALPALLLFDLPPLERDVLLLFAVLPPAVINFLLAERYGPNPAETAAIVMIGTLLSLPVLALALGFVLAP